MTISRPISPYTDKYVFAVIKRKDNAGCTVMSIAIIHRIVITGPDQLMTAPVVAIIIHMRMASCRINPMRTIMVDDPLGMMVHPAV